MKKLLHVQVWCALFLMMCCVAQSNLVAQTSRILGRVTDSKSGIPLFGASVRLKVNGKVLGSFVDKEGKYVIQNVPSGAYEITASILGYKTKSEKVSLSGGDITKDIQLSEDLLLLEEAVVVGYGSTQKRDLTGAYSTVKTEEIVNVPTPSLETTMQGRVSGVQIVQSNGMAGSATTVRVRGVGSITANTQPLFVIDGIPMTTGDFGSNSIASNVNALSDINPNDIESMDILKDAAATAIYGSRGANGVVLITTKRGQKGTAKVSASMYRGIINETNRLPLVSRDQWIDLYFEASSNDAWAANRFQGTRPNPTTTVLPRGFTRQTAANTNWLDAVLRTGYVSEATASVSGSSNDSAASTRYYFNTTYRDEKGFIVGNDYTRLNSRLTIDQKVGKVLEFGGSFSISRAVNNRINSAWAGGIGTAVSSALPIFPIYNTDGTYWESQTGLNPVADLDNRKFIATTWRTLTNGYLQLNIIEGLRFRTEIGLDLLNLREDRFTPELLSAIPSAEDRRVQVFNWTTNSYLNYNTTIDEKHDINAVVGMSVQRSEQRDVGTSGINFPNSYFQTPQAAAVRNGYAFQTEFGFLSYFGRLSYKFMNRYLAEVSVRSDGSSRFGQNNRYGTFPAASLGWIVSEEDFLKGNEVVTFLKLRTSYGIAGNAEIGNFTWQGTFAPGANYNNQPGVRPSQLANTDLSWETSSQLDIALDFGLLSDRITGSVNYYNRVSKDMLLNERVPGSSGFQSIIRNIGQMTNQGVEFNIRSFNFSGEFEWSSDFNITFNTNRIDNLGSTTSPDAIDLGFGETRAIVGYPFATFFIVRSAGVDPATGAPLYYRPRTVDGVVQNGLNGAGVDLEVARDAQGNPLPWSAAWRVPTGKNYPDFFGGFTNNFRWKNFDLSILINFSFGNKIYDDAGKRLVGNIGFGWNQMTKTLDRWQKPGDVTDVPRLSLSDNRDINTDRFIYDGSFIRLRNVTLGYTLPTSITQDWGVSRLRVYVTAINPALLYNNFPGWDPELVRDHGNDQQRNGNQSVTYLAPPQAKTISFGVNLDF